MPRLTRVVLAGGMAASLLATPGLTAEDEWSFAVAPLYLWAKNIDGVASTGGAALPLDLSFEDDILDNLGAAFSIHAEANKGDWTLFVEANYAKLEPSGTNSLGPVQFEADVDFKDYMYEGGAAWRFAKTDTSSWELYGGLRYLKQDVTVNLDNNLPGDLLPDKISTGDSWMHPFAGVRYTALLGDKWVVRVKGDYGYEGSDNTAVQGLAMVDYRFTALTSAFVGYRYLDLDYSGGGRDRDSYGFDGDQQGPVIGVTFNF